MCLLLTRLPIFDELRAINPGIVNEIGGRPTKIAGVAAGKDDPEKFAKRVEKAVSALRGDEFKNLRAVELVERFQENAPEEVKKSLEKVRSDFSDKLRDDIAKFAGKFKEISGLENGTEIKLKIKNLPGDAVRHLIILDEIRQSADKRTADALGRAGQDLEKSIIEGGDIKQKAEEQIERAQTAINQLEAERLVSVSNSC